MREDRSGRAARSLNDMFEALGERYLQMPFTQGTDQEVGFLAELLKLTPRHRIVDVACGPGRHSVALARRGFKVTGIDISDKLLGIARRTAELEKVPVEFVKADARDIPYTGEFDAALCLCEGAFGLLEHDAENERVLNAIFRALKPGGKLALTALNLLRLFRNEKDLEGFDPQTNMLLRHEKHAVEGGEEEYFRYHERYFTFPELKIMLDRAGFRHILGFGCRVGDYSSRAITVDDYEMLVYAEKPAR